jgi:hypothetical protein
MARAIGPKCLSSSGTHRGDATARSTERGDDLVLNAQVSDSSRRTTRCEYDLANPCVSDCNLFIDCDRPIWLSEASAVAEDAIKVGRILLLAE